MAVALVLALCACSGATVRKDVPARGASIPFTLYIMSKCPYAASVLTSLQPVLANFGPWVDFRLELIGGEEGGTLYSLHGEDEVKGDLAYACAQEELPGDRRYMSLIACMNADFSHIPANLDSCLASSLSPEEAAKVRGCLESGKGDALLKASFDRSMQAEVQGSPTMVIAGKPYSGGRTVEAFVRALCRAREGEGPRACRDIPIPVPLDVVIIGDVRCRLASCDVARLERSLGTILPDARVKTIDWAEQEARELLDRCGLSHLPAVLLPPSVRQTEAGMEMERHLRESSDPAWLYLELKSTHDPRSEICDNGQDDTGDGLADCADPGCNGSMECRPEVKGQLELFVMSECPFATRLFEALDDVLVRFRYDPLVIVVHYIGEQDSEGKPTSLHGQTEVDEDIRQLCVARYFPNHLQEYIRCRLPRLREEAWSFCYGDGIDGNVVEACVASEGETMLLEDMETARKLGLNASPTWIVNGRFPTAGFSSEEQMIETICEHNPGFAACRLGAIGDGDGPTVDEMALEKECNAGRADACVTLAELYQLGLGDPPGDPARFSRFAARACELKDGWACDQLAQQQQADGNAAAAQETCLRASTRGSRCDCCWQALNDIIRPPEGKEVDEEREMRFVDPMCSAGDDTACQLLVELLALTSKNPKLRDPIRARTLATSRCDRNPQSGCCLHAGVLWAEGLGGPQNCERAWSYLGYGCDGSDDPLCIRYLEALTKCPGWIRPAEEAPLPDDGGMPFDGTLQEDEPPPGGECAPQ